PSTSRPYFHQLDRASVRGRRRLACPGRCRSEPPQDLEKLVDVGFGRLRVHDAGPEPCRAAETGRREPAFAGRLERVLEAILVLVERTGIERAGVERAGIE